MVKSVRLMRGSRSRSQHGFLPQPSAVKQQILPLSRQPDVRGGQHRREANRWQRKQLLNYLMALNFRSGWMSIGGRQNQRAARANVTLALLRVSSRDRPRVPDAARENQPGPSR